jgi:hypothetical protein
MPGKSLKTSPDAGICLAYPIIELSMAEILPEQRIVLAQCQLQRRFGHHQCVVHKRQSRLPERKQRKRKTFRPRLTSDPTNHLQVQARPLVLLHDSQLNLSIQKCVFATFPVDDLEAGDVDVALKAIINK